MAVVSAVAVVVTGAAVVAAAPAADAAGVAAGPAVVVGVVSDPAGGGWTVTAAGAVSSFGGAAVYGDLAAVKVSAPVVGMAATPDGGGYWLVASDGGIFSYGDARFYGSTGGIRLDRPVVGMAATPDGGGYWLVASDGGIFSYGDARFYGSTGGVRLARPVVGMAAAPDGGGYWLVASDGGIFSYGDARFYGSGAGKGQTYAGMAPTLDGGYRLAAASGAVSSFEGEPVATAMASRGAVGVSAVQDGPGPQLRVTWSYPAPDPTAETLVALYRRDSSGWAAVTSGLCAQACTATIFYYLQPGATYEAAISEILPTGTTVAVSTPVTITNPCPGQVCVSVDAARPIGPADHAAQGLLHSSYPGPDQNYLSTLDVTMFRESVPYRPDGTLDWSTWPTGRPPDARTTLIVSDAWWAANGGNPPAPTGTALTRYSTWLHTYVRAVLASGHHVNYWEPLNEPGLGYYNPTITAKLTPTQLYHLFLVSYQVIRGIDPAAQIIGPSMAAFIPAPGYQIENGFNMADFLDYAAAHHLTLAAINWHYNSPNPLFITDQVAQARQMIAAHPGLGHPLIFLNEYGTATTQQNPGTDVAYLAAITNSHIAFAGRSCWNDNCDQPTLDSLLTPNGTQPLADYWVRRYYATMTGHMLTATTTSDNLTTIASYDPAGSSVRVLLGRGFGYTGTGGSRQGEAPHGGSPHGGHRRRSPVPVTIAVHLPWTTGTISLTETRISGRATGAYQPAPPTATAPSAVNPSGTTTVTIPSFAAGDAWTVTITHQN